MAEARVTGPGVAEMKVLASRIRGADPLLRRELRRNFRGIANPIAGQARDSILSMPSHHDGTLRGEVARTVTSSVGITASGVRLDIVSLGRRMPEGKRTLPAHLNDPKGWGHPVFPRGERFTLGRSRARRYARRPAFLRPLVKRGAWTWVHQVGKPGWFDETISRAARDAQRAAEQALDATARKLGG